MTNNSKFREDGLFGYDILGKNAIIDGPNHKITFNSGVSPMEFPILSNTDNTKMIYIVQSTNDEDVLEKEIQDIRKINYVKKHELYPNYKSNLQIARNITQEISESKIKISSQL